MAQHPLANAMDENHLLRVLANADLNVLLQERREETQEALSLDEVRMYARKTLEAMNYLHGMKMAHLDIKPENILLDYDGHIRLCDFGFAVPVNKGSDGNDVPLNDGCGTAMYVAPEIASGFMS